MECPVVRRQSECQRIGQAARQIYRQTVYKCFMSTGESTFMKNSGLVFIVGCMISVPLALNAVEFRDPAQFSPTWNSANPGISHNNTIPTAALLGNGSLGVVNGGDADRKLFVLTRGDLWSCGDFTCGLEPVNVGPISFADFEIIPGKSSVTSTDTLDLPTATLKTCGGFGKGNVKIRSFVAADEDVFVVTGVSSVDDEWRLRLSAHNQTAVFPREAKVTDSGFHVRRFTLNLLPKNDPRGWVTNAAAAVSAVGAELSGMKVEGDGVVEANAKIRANVPFAFLVCHDPARRFSRAELEKIELAHCNWWKEWWNRSRIAIGDDELERFYMGQIYLLGASVRQGKFPPGLYGIWQTTDSPRWHNDFHMNYNYVATFYGCFTANRCEVAETIPDPLIAYLPRAIRNAKENLPFLWYALSWSGKMVMYQGIKDYLNRRTDLADGIDDAVNRFLGRGDDAAAGQHVKAMSSVLGALLAGHLMVGIEALVQLNHREHVQIRAVDLDSQTLKLIVIAVCAVMREVI